MRFTSKVPLLVILLLTSSRVLADSTAQDNWIPPGDLLAEAAQVLPKDAMLQVAIASEPGTLRKFLKFIDPLKSSGCRRFVLVQTQAGRADEKLAGIFCGSDGRWHLQSVSEVR